MRFCNAPDNDGHLFQKPRVPSLNEKGHRLASLVALAWLASWVDITVYWVNLEPWRPVISLVTTLRRHLGPTPPTLSIWCPFWDQDGAQDVAEDVPTHRNIWTDGC